MSTTTSEHMSSDISDILGLYDLEANELEIFLQNVGELIIESATLKYMMGLTQEQRTAFESWLEVYEANENILEVALTMYPEFAALVTDEMAAFQSEVIRLKQRS